MRPFNGYAGFADWPYWLKVRSGTFIAIDSIEEVDGGISAQGHFIERKDHMKKHEGKILIQVDEQNPNKVVAKNLITGETAEALCSPADEFDFEAGARLALKRLAKKKYWTGKVVCIETLAVSYFVVGEVYSIENGILRSRTGESWENVLGRITSVNELNKKLVNRYQFIEYKGGAD